MFGRIVKRACFLIGLLGTSVGFGVVPGRAGEPETVWKAGSASVVTTPEELTWMAGYASRDKPAEGKVHDLNAKALAIEDAQGLVVDKVHELAARTNTP